MRYKIKKETKPTLSTFGKYKAVAVHNQTIESRQIYEEAARHMSISGGALEGLMMTVAKVDDPKAFRAKKHIRGVRLHFLPESENGSPELYRDITFERDKQL